MYNFSGIWYRIWGSASIFVILGVTIILFSRPWAEKIKLKDLIIALLSIILGVCMSLFYLSRIAFPDVSSYTGEFVAQYRTSNAPPLPFTSKYLFWEGEGKKYPFYLDTFSKKEICPELESGRKYTVYYDKFTKVIVKVEPVE